MSLLHHAFSFIILFFSLAFSPSKFTHPTNAQNLDVHNHGKETFIVRINNELKPANFSDVDEWYKSILTSLSIRPNGDSYPVIYVYKTVFHGFSARLTLEQADALKAHPSVVGVFPDQTYELHTTRTPHFLGLNSYHHPAGLLKESDMGSDVVIGIIDTGIWPESPSFRDDGLGPIPAHFKGACEGGKDFPSSLCNKKLVGVRYFLDGMSSDSVCPAQLESARDVIGHGTHTASTAAGRALVGNSSFFGYAQGQATGIAPKARLAVYKVCQPTIGCRGSNVLAGIDKAVEDGVDVISTSLGGPTGRYAGDPIAIGSYGAVQKGVFFSASAGNRGPQTQTVSNIAPWLTTVGASTIDRTFPADLILGNGDVLTGTSLYTGKPLDETKYFPIVQINDTSYGKLCMGSGLPSETVKGKIVICLRGMESPPSKGVNVKNAGGVGIVVTNDLQYGEALFSDAYFGIPGLTITNSAREKLLNYIKTSGHDAKARMVFHGTKVPSGQAPSVAGFSSRGPNLESIYVLKPDVIAPGVDILASWPDAIPPARIPQDPRRSGFNILSGTSMSCPHVAGIAALLKGAHPDWTPAMIRSAMMTTTYNTCRNGKPILAQENNLPASVWLRGAGHVDPEKANDPGLVYDLTEDDYIDFLCASNYTKSEIMMIAKKEVSCEKRATKKEWDLNYPAIVVAPKRQVERPSNVNVTVTRTLTNVGSGSSSYRVELVSPKGAKVRVNPSELSFKVKGEKKSFEVQVLAEKEKGNVMDAEEGSLTWTDGKHRVTIPLIVGIL